MKFLERIAGTRKRLYQFTAERRNQRTHPIYTKPQLLAIRPNEVWSWDITKLNGPAK